MPNVPTTFTSAPFSGCTGLKKISVGGLEEIKDGMFYVGSQRIEEVEIRGTVGKIGNNAFNSSVAFSSNNPSNGHGFEFTTSSARLIIRDGITSIGNGAFRNCDIFTEVEIEGSNTNISIGSGAFYGCDRIEKAALSEGVTTIGSNAFNGFSVLTTITIGRDVNTIETNAFTGCEALNRIMVNPGNTMYSSIDNVLIGNGGYSLVMYPNGKVEISYTIPASINITGSGAFSANKHLEEIHIGENVVFIAEEAFTQLEKLHKLTIDSQSLSIAENGFSHCPNLTNVVYHGEMEPTCTDQSFIETNIKSVQVEQQYKQSGI